MPSECESRMRRWNLGCRQIACAGLSLAACALTGCEQQAAEQPVATGSTAPTTENQVDDGLPQPEARSALGKAKQSAERLVNEDVAEYNKKIEEAAEGKFP
ncbi:MAG: hypothetical protein RLY21_1316 [Planctomycetota bacterium]|jgi:hypothetical protein